MKRLLLVSVFFSLVFTINGQKSVNRLIDKMKEHKNAHAITLPGWFIRLGIDWTTDDEFKLEQGFKDLVGGIKKLRVLVIDEKVEIDTDKMKSIVSQIKEKDGYVDYAIVREKNNLVNVIVKEDKTKIKSLVILTKSNDGFAIVILKTNIEMEDLKKSNLSFNKHRQI